MSPTTEALEALDAFLEQQCAGVGEVQRLARLRQTRVERAAAKEELIERQRARFVEVWSKRLAAGIEEERRRAAAEAAAHLAVPALMEPAAWPADCDVSIHSASEPPKPGLLLHGTHDACSCNGQLQLSSARTPIEMVSAAAVPPSGMVRWSGSPEPTLHVLATLHRSATEGEHQGDPLGEEASGTHLLPSPSEVVRAAATVADERFMDYRR